MKVLAVEVTTVSDYYVGISETTIFVSLLFLMFAMTSHHFVEPLVLSVLDLG